MKKLFIQFIKFGIVGVMNTVVALSIYYFLVWVGVHYFAANAVAFIISVLNAFFWSSKFVFKGSEKSLLVRLAKVYAAYGFTFLLASGTLVVMVELLHISELIAPLLNLCITVPINFCVNKFWAFR
jgi:putative flippase GtrA